MAADFNKPVVGDLYTAVLAGVRDNDDALAKGLDPAIVTPTNTPTNAIRWTSAANKWEKFNGTTWDPLSALYAISISGNAATATSATSATSATDATNATNATHLTGGVAGAIPWQSATGVTAYTAAGTAGYVLTAAGTGSPVWVEKVPIANGGTGAATAAAAIAALGGAALAGASFTGGINEARDTLAMHATTMDLWSKPNIIEGTGSAVTITDIADAPQAGARRRLYPIAGSIVTDGAIFDVDGSTNATAATGDCWEFEAITTSTFKVRVIKNDGINVSAAAVSDMANGSVGVFGLPAGTTAERELGLDFVGIRYNTTLATVEIWDGALWRSITSTAVSGIRQALFAHGYTGAVSSLSNKVSNVGVVATDTAGVGTARRGLAGSGYGTNLGVMAYGVNGAGTNIATKNLIGATGVVAADVVGVGTVRSNLAGARYGSGLAFFGFGGLSNEATFYSVKNLVNASGVIAADVTGVGTARDYVSAAAYGGDKALFGYGYTGTWVSMTNLVSNTGVVATDTTGVGTARRGRAAADYGYDKAIFGFGYTGAYSAVTNLVSNTGVVATDTTGVGTGRAYLAAAGYGYDKAIFGFGSTSGPSYQSMTNLVTGAGVVGSDVTGVGTNRQQLAASCFANT